MRSRTFSGITDFDVIIATPISFASMLDNLRVATALAQRCGAGETGPIAKSSAESGTVANPVAATRDCHFARPCRPASALPTILPPAPRRRPALHSVAGGACDQSDPTAGNRHRGRTPLFLWGNPLAPAPAGVSLREACAVNNPPRRERAFRFTTQRPGHVRNWCEIGAKSTQLDKSLAGWHRSGKRRGFRQPP